MPVLQIIPPVSFISLTIRMYVSTESVCSIVMKLSCIDIAVCMIEYTLSLGHSILPVAIVLGSIIPYLDAFAMLDKLESTFADIRRPGLLHLSCVAGSDANNEVLNSLQVIPPSVDGIGMHIGIRDEFGRVMGLDVGLLVFNFIDAGMSSLAALVAHDYLF